MQKLTCLHCGNELKALKQKQSKLCSVECSKSFKLKKTIDKFVENVEHGAALQKNYDEAKVFLIDRRDNKCEECGVVRDPKDLYVYHKYNDLIDYMVCNLKLLCKDCFDFKMRV